MGRLYLVVDADRTSGLIKSNDDIGQEIVDGMETSLTIDESEYELTIDVWEPPTPVKFGQLRAALDAEATKIRGKKMIPSEKAAELLWALLKRRG